jgi:fatty acid desaturase
MPFYYQKSGGNESMKSGISRKSAIVLNRVILCAVVALSLVSYLWQPVRMLGWMIDVLIRTYLHFIAGAMAHEATHGHLGTTRKANLWWGRVALIPTTVPNVTFRKTHLHHHAATNIPEKDPDEFLNTKRFWEIPLRALVMPHHWVLWLRKQGRFTRSDLLEYALTYVAYVGIYGFIAIFAGVERVLLGLFPAAILHSFLLWYFFAIKTHEGYSTGDAETRSHNYYGRWIYWFSFGLSMHRLHHMKPGLAWLQMATEVTSGTWLQRFRVERDIRPDLKRAA